MENLHKYIEKLLAHHDYVVVPELGGFVVQMQSAVIQGDCITPPLATVGFNPLMHHSDGLLVVEIARAEGVTYRKAMELLDVEVKKIKKQFAESGQYQFGNLGFFSKSENENLIFTPSVRCDFLPGNLGMSDLHVSQRQLLKVAESKRVSFALPSARTLRYVAAAVLLFGMLMISPKINDGRRIDSASLFLLPIAETLNEKTKNIEALSAEINEIKAVDSVIQNEVSFLFHVVVASLPSSYSAQKYCAQLKSENHESAHVLNPAKSYRIAIQSFSSKREAIKYMENLRETDRRFHDAWVFCE